MYGLHNMSNVEKFRSGNLLENGSKNQWNLPCSDLLLFLICTWSFGKNSLLRLHIKDNNNSPHSKFHRFLFPFSSKFPDLNFAPYVFFIYSCYETGTWHKQWAWVSCGENPLTLLVRKYIEIGNTATFEWSWKWKVTHWPTVLLQPKYVQENLITTVLEFWIYLHICSLFKSILLYRVNEIVFIAIPIQFILYLY